MTGMTFSWANSEKQSEIHSKANESLGDLSQTLSLVAFYLFQELCRMLLSLKSCFYMKNLSTINKEK